MFVRVVIVVVVVVVVVLVAVALEVLGIAVGGVVEEHRCHWGSILAGEDCKF